MVCLGHLKTSYELIHRLLSSLRVFRYRKMSVLAPFHNVTEWRNCLLCVTRLILYSDIGNCVKFKVIRPSDQNRCVLSVLDLCVFYPSVFRLSIDMLFTAHHPGLMKTDVFLQLLASKFCLFSVCSKWVSLLSFLRILVFTYCRMDCEDEDISTEFFRCGSTSAHLFDS